MSLREDVANHSGQVVDAVGCADPADLKCLQAANVETLLAAYKQLEGLVRGSSGVAPGLGEALDDVLSTVSY